MVLGGSVNVFVLVNLYSTVGVHSLSELLPLPAGEEGRVSAVCFYVLCRSC